MGAVELYGTAEPVAEAEIIRHGDVSLGFQDGALRHICLGGIEIIRQIAFLVRDRDWGTVRPEIGAVGRTTRGDDLLLRFPMVFRSNGAEQHVSLSLTIGTTGLTFAAESRISGIFETNRTGFTVLHPVTGVAGAPARVTHSDGSVDHSRFPDLIEPWQPFMDIVHLEHEAHGLTISCAFEGDTFEMEDQRQWGDASYKTYNRPLALPWPYQLTGADTLRQSVTLSWSGAGIAAKAAPVAIPAGTVFPDLALVVTPDEARNPEAAQMLALVAPQRILAHVDATRTEPVSSQLAAFAALQVAYPAGIYDLELICRFRGDPVPELTSHARDLGASGLAVASVFVCPSVDRQSTPPGSAWPDCPPLDQIHAAAARAFPGIKRGGGMASFFPELNRKRPPAGLDFVSHGFCPIIHASDDLAVMETLEAVPHIARSARAIIGAAEYRIGPSTIAMRQNPYGSRTIPNPKGGRVAMTDDDPRHRAAFGAAWTLGMATALAPFAPAVWTPAALFGPRGLGDGAWPVAALLRELAASAGQQVIAAQIQDGEARLRLGDRLFRANLTAVQTGDLPPFGWVVTPL
ncbi:hypothetical protein [Rhodobacter sp. 24-YEA-8]|uniref:hypothetical protein n=1 Tax=Rhodobacter sp. 24-YEA-8 TaxID=1884310 RepID=UPI0008995CD3|nr:hypothetical protein [Rhodobacter sp. 24-YEA-8]SEC65430.1 hypothetical protein SAMN05519105_3005 [Rhodobacter sp. 24-YEA-8]